MMPRMCNPYPTNDALTLTVAKTFSGSWWRNTKVTLSRAKTKCRCDRLPPREFVGVWHQGLEDTPTRMHLRNYSHARFESAACILATIAIEYEYLPDRLHDVE
jgi:hypothetical protein